MISNGSLTSYTKDFTISITVSTFVPVTNITGIPTTVEKSSTVSSLQLTGTVAPTNATNKTIVWSKVSGNGTINSSTGLIDLSSITAAGSITVRATIVNGTNEGTTNYTKDFTISITYVPNPYVTFKSDSDMTITPIYTNTGQLQYSTNLTTWTNISSLGTTSSAKTIHMRGIMSTATLFNNTHNDEWNFTNATNLSIEGNLNTLLNYQNPPTTLEQYCYYRMFNDCSSLTSISSDLLPATTLGEDCYFCMFGRCTSLIRIPSGLLPATTLKEDCYTLMFYSCSSLIRIPSDLLPATTLKNKCYQGMFNSCTSLSVKISSDTFHRAEFRIPYTGTGISATDALTNMFLNTDGTMNNTPTINTIYYIRYMDE
jgi:hypothetical protein